MDNSDRLDPLGRGESLIDLESCALCVDLDGTLVKTDTLVELLLALLKKSFLSSIILIPFWLLRGKAPFKREIARRADLELSLLPYDTMLLDYLARQKRLGKTTILTTAADEIVATKIAKHLDLFSAVLASDGVTNLSGNEKLKRIREYLGSSSFVYAGNASIDMPIWRASRGAILASHHPRLMRKLRGVAKIIECTAERKRNRMSVLQAIRIYQWVKNVLIFIPLIAAHQVFNATHLLNALIAFISFSMISSSCYLVNDLLDLESDRRHPTKKGRPFASGDMSTKMGIMLCPVLAIIGLVLSVMLPFSFTILLCMYYLLTFAYSCVLKKVVIVDVIVLALFYGLRVIGGGVAVNIQISNWLLSFVMFLFISLAFLKRYSELYQVQSRKEQVNTARGYLADDLELLAVMGVATGYLTVLVLGLYINSEDVTPLYEHPEILWLVCLLLLYWVSHLWLVAKRGMITEDPIWFILGDRVSYVSAALAAIVIILAVR